MEPPADPPPPPPPPPAPPPPPPPLPPSPRPASKYLDTHAMDWRPFDEAPGVYFKTLKTHRPGTGVTLLLRFDPGAAYPAHRHPAGEEYQVLEGELTDGGASYGVGTYVWHPPGSVHRPRSATGAVVLVFLRAAIELV